MSIIKRLQGDKVYLYLQLTGKQFYLGTADSVEPDKVYEALSYLQERIETRRNRDLEYYRKVGRMLEEMLPEEARRRLPQALLTGGTARLMEKAKPTSLPPSINLNTLMTNLDKIDISLHGDQVELRGKLPKDFLRRIREERAVEARSKRKAN